MTRKRGPDGRFIKADDVTEISEGRALTYKERMAHKRRGDVK